MVQSTIRKEHDLVQGKVVFELNLFRSVRVYMYIRVRVYMYIRTFQLYTLGKIDSKGLCVVSLAFFFFFFFNSRVFTHVLDTNMYQNAKKITQREPYTQHEHYALGKNTSWLRFFSLFVMFEVTKISLRP